MSTEKYQGGRANETKRDSTSIFLFLLSGCAVQVAPNLTEIERYPFYTPPVKTVVDLRAMIQTQQSSILEGMKKAGNPEVFGALVRQFPHARISIVEYQPGQTFRWILYRSNEDGEVKAVMNSTWDGNTPLKSYEFFIDTGDKRYVFAVPLLTGNLALKDIFVIKTVIVPGPKMYSERVVTVPGPERLVEKIVNVPGPERVVEKVVEVPGPEMIVEKVVEVPVEKPRSIIEELTPKWNSWFKDDSGRKTDYLVQDEEDTYNLLFDISLFDYKKLGFGSFFKAIPVDTTLNEKITQRKNEGKTKLTLQVRPIAIGDEVIIKSNQSHHNLTLDLNKLSPSDSQKNLLTDLQRGDITVNEFIKSTQAGEITPPIIVEASKTGCATIALSVWDKKGTTPLDHLIVTVPVVAEQSNGMLPTCDSPSLEGGLDTLLSNALAQRDPDATPPDVAMHFFEYLNQTIAVFADRKGIQEDDQKGVYSWVMKTKLSDYVNGGDLTKVIKLARKRAGEKDVYIHPYKGVAKELTKKIFTNGEDGAKSAQEIFNKRLKEFGDKGIMLLVKAVDETNNPIYVPLGLLAASGNELLADGKIYMIQPLPKKSNPQYEKCVDNWAFGMSSELQKNHTDDLLSISNANNLSWLEWFEDRNGFESYFALKEIEATSGEGLVLVSHHSNGYLWFGDSEDRIIKEDIVRKYPPGSAVLLAACSTTGTEQQDKKIIDYLNENGIDTIIASPFPVDEEYGAMLAIEFTEAIKQAKETNSNNKMLIQFFDEATREVAEKLNTNKTDLTDMSLEFIILGDYNLKLCPSVNQ